MFVACHLKEVRKYGPLQLPGVKLDLETRENELGHPEEFFLSGMRAVSHAPTSPL